MGNNMYLQLNKMNKCETIIEMRDFALKNKVPIINDEGLLYLLQLARLKKVKKILEIGTAIGYSAINLAMQDDDVLIDTIERDEVMCERASYYIKQVNLEKRIRLFPEDALELDISLLQKDYDMIFIDAGKAQYKKFFQKYDKLLNKEGIIVIDNLLFHGFVDGNMDIKSKNLRSLVKKIRDFREWLAENEEYNTLFLTIGDGMAVSEKNDVDNRNKKQEES